MAVKKTTTFTESNININNNTSSLSIKIYFSANNSETWFSGATLSCTCNGTTKTKSVSHSRGGSVSATFAFDNIVHNSDGTKSVSWSWRCPTGTSVLGTISDSGTRTLTTINRKANVTSATNFTDTTNATMQFSNTGGFSLMPYINFYSDSSYSTKLIGISRSTGHYSSPYTWSLTESERNAIRNALGTRTSAYATVGVETKNGSTSLGFSSKGVTFTNAIQPPTFINFEVEDINPQTLAITNDKNKFIMGYSTLQITISGDDKAIANKGASMSYYLVNGTQYTYTDNLVITIEKWNNENIEVTAVDSRGISTKVTKTVTKAEYTPLEKGNIDITRLGNISEETTLNYTGKIQQLLPSGESNNLTASYQYKTTSGENYTSGTTDITPTVDSDGNFSFEDYILGDTQNGFDIDNSYDILLIVSDVLSSIQYTYTLNSGIPAIAVKGNKVALHGTYDETIGGDVQINGKSLIDIIHPVGSIYLSMSDISPSILFGGTWERIGVGRTLISAGGGTDPVVEPNNATDRGDYTGGVNWFLAGTMGGETDHKLTTAQLPAHKHTVNNDWDIGAMQPNQVSRRQVGSGGTNRGYAFTTNSTSSNSALGFNSGTDNTGSGNSHNIMQPYIAVYMWKRTE